MAKYGIQEFQWCVFRAIEITSQNLIVTKPDFIVVIVVLVGASALMRMREERQSSVFRLGASSLKSEKKPPNAVRTKTK